MLTSYAHHNMIGGLSDVGRHAILAALEKPTIDKVTVITEYPELLDETNWECNCPGGHTNPFNDPSLSSRLEMVKIDTWKKEQPNLSQHFVGATGVVSCLGHRQPGWKNKELITRGLIAYDGNKQVIKAMGEAKVDRVAVISSFAIGDGGTKAWPHWASKFMCVLFKTCQRKAGHDLLKMEKCYVQSNLDYLFVKPVGIGEDVEPDPDGHYYLQEGDKKTRDETGKIYPNDIVGGNMAKMDVARFMVEEIIHPTLYRTSQVVGAKPGTPMSG